MKRNLFLLENNLEQVDSFHWKTAKKDRKKVVKVCQSCSFFKL